MAAASTSSAGSWRSKASCYNCHDDLGLDRDADTKRLRAMELTLILDDRLADDLRALADARGLSLDEMGRAALLAGLDRLNSPMSDLGILDLGPLHATPPTAEEIARMRSPIIALGPLPERILKPFDMLIQEISDHAD